MSPITAPGTIPRSVEELPDKFEEFVQEMREFRREQLEFNKQMWELLGGIAETMAGIGLVVEDTQKDMKTLLDEVGKLRKDVEE